MGSNPRFLAILDVVTPPVGKVGLAHFRGIFVSSTIGLRKPDAVAFDHVVEAIGVPADRILFFDDSAVNIAGARARGLQAVQVGSIADVERALAELAEVEQR